MSRPKAQLADILKGTNQVDESMGTLQSSLLTLSSLAITIAPMPSDQDKKALSSLQVLASRFEQPVLQSMQFQIYHLLLMSHVF